MSVSDRSSVNHPCHQKPVKLFSFPNTHAWFAILKVWLVSVILYCFSSSGCILLHQMPRYCLLHCQQCDPYNLVKQAIQKSMAITQVIDFSASFGRWLLIVTSEMICQCRMLKFTLLNCCFITYKALLFIDWRKTLNFESYSSEHSLPHIVSSHSFWSLIPKALIISYAIPKLSL